MNKEPFRASKRFAGRVFISALVLFLFRLPAIGQTPKDLERDRNRGVVMLSLVKDYIKEFY
jgi:hypothetical protein